MARTTIRILVGTFIVMVGAFLVGIWVYTQSRQFSRVAQAPVAPIVAPVCVQCCTPVATAVALVATPVAPKVDVKKSCTSDGIDWDANMNWTGPGDGTCDIHQTGQFLIQIRRDGRATFSTTVPGSVRITKGRINGSNLIVTEKVLHLNPGTYLVTESTGENSGGFRWTPDKGYGWNR